MIAHFYHELEIRQGSSNAEETLDSINEVLSGLVLREYESESVVKSV